MVANSEINPGSALLMGLFRCKRLPDSIHSTSEKLPKGDSEAAAWSLENGIAPGYYAAGFNNMPVRGRVM